MPHPFNVGDRVLCIRSMGENGGVQGRRYTVTDTGGDARNYWIRLNDGMARCSVDRFQLVAREPAVVEEPVPEEARVLHGYQYRKWVVCYMGQGDRVPSAREHSSEEGARDFIRRVNEGGHRLLATKLVSFMY